MLGGVVLRLCGGKAVALPLIGLAEPWQVTFIALGAPGFLVALALLLVREPERRQNRAQAMPVDGSGRSFARLLLSRWRFFLPVYLGLSFSIFAGFGFAAWMPTVAIRRYALEPAHVGLVMGAIAVAMGTISPLAVGMASDWAGRRWPGTGRLWTIVVLFAVQIPLTAAWAFLPVPFPLFLALSAINGAASAGLSSSGHIVLQELMPNHMRARAIALFSTLSSFVGMGGGPVVMALITQYVFHAEMMIGYAVALVVLTCTVLGLLSFLAAIGHMRSLAGRGDAGLAAGQAA